MITGIKKKTETQLQVISFPFWLVTLVGTLLVVFWGYAFVSSNQLKLEDYLIFNFVILVFLAVPKYRSANFDARQGICEIFSRRLWMTEEQKISLSEIKQVEVLSGKGQFSGGCTLYLMIPNKRIAVADSDIQFGSEKHISSIRDELSAWLRLHIH